MTNNCCAAIVGAFLSCLLIILVVFGSVKLKLSVVSAITAFVAVPLKEPY